MEAGRLHAHGRYAGPLAATAAIVPHDRDRTRGRSGRPGHARKPRGGRSANRLPLSPHPPTPGGHALTSSAPPGAPDLAPPSGYEGETREALFGARRFEPTTSAPETAPCCGLQNELANDRGVSASSALQDSPTCSLSLRVALALRAPGPVRDAQWRLAPAPRLGRTPHVLSRRRRWVACSSLLPLDQRLRREGA
jgi:hypothetical protein